LLQAADVWFGYGSNAVLRGVTLTIPSNGFIGILGPNGAGKTTLLRLLAGTRQPQRGRVTLDGAPLSHFSRTLLARRMAVVPQETQLAFDYTVAEVTTMGRYPHLGAFEVEGPSDLAIVDASLAATGTLHLKDRSFATLSGGEKQRVVIAAALAQLGGLAAAGPDRTAGGGHLVLDEPTASLDLAYQLEVATVLRQLHTTKAITIVVSTHDLNLASSLCETLVLMRDGLILATGPTREVLTTANVRTLYGVDADVLEHPSGHVVVVPLTRTDTDDGARP
jgi:iron complex transport system ATP-binding protein